MKKYLIILGIAAVHFVVTKIVTMLTFFAVTANPGGTRMSSMEHFLLMISKVLYFPVMTMAWYPRRFFPGNFIVIPIIINSLIWAILIFMIYVLIQRWRIAER